PPGHSPPGWGSYRRRDLDGPQELARGCPRGPVRAGGPVRHLDAGEHDPESLAPRWRMKKTWVVLLSWVAVLGVIAPARGARAEDGGGPRWLQAWKKNNTVWRGV